MTQRGIMVLGSKFGVLESSKGVLSLSPLKLAKPEVVVGIVGTGDGYGRNDVNTGRTVPVTTKRMKNYERRRAAGGGRVCVCVGVWADQRGGHMPNLPARERQI